MPAVGIPFRDYPPDAIGVRDLGRNDVELTDREGRSCTGSTDEALAALAELQRGDDPNVVWSALPTVR